MDKKLRVLERPTSFLLVILLLTSCSDNDEPPTFNEMLETELVTLAQADQLPSLSVLILKGDSQVFKLTWGFADVSAGIEVTENSIYYLASISKVITAIASLQLVERGMLDLDVDINTYLPFEVRNPNYPDDSITTRMLLEHRTSLDDRNYTVYSNQNAPPMYPGIENILVPGSIRYDPTIWRNVRPGTSFLYSNITTALLGYLIEIVSGVDYNEYCKENIFKPLGMSNTGHSLNDIDLSNMARPYVNGSVVNFYSTEFYPSGMLKSTLLDLAKLAGALMNNGSFEGVEILSQSSNLVMLSKHHSDSPVGFIWYNYQSLRGVWGHAGWFRGYQTMMFFDPNRDLAAIILSNSSTPPSNPILFKGSITRKVNEAMFRY